MADTPAIKIEKDYEEPRNVESEVPGSQEIREVDAQNNSFETSSDIDVTGAGISLSPVITVTKKESTLTKGDIQMQKVTVTEDISVEETENGGYFTISRETRSSTQTESQPGKTVITTESREEIKETNMDKEAHNSQGEKKSKIPIMRLRQVVERVKRERQQQRARDKPRRSSIPKLTDAKKVVKRESSLQMNPRTEDEFEKLYEEIVDNKLKEIDDKILAIKLEEPEKIDSKFEELIHSYDEEDINDRQKVSRISKIPALRKRHGNKNTSTETKLKDGGFNVTASSIKIKRFSRGNSRDLSKDQQSNQTEVTETINIKESGDNAVFVKQTVKPKITVRSSHKQINKDGQEINHVETIENTEYDTEKSVTKTIIKESATTGIPVKTETISHSLSRELTTNDQNVNDVFEEDIKNSSNTEVVTIEEINDDGTSTITTKTTVRETVQSTPVITETVIHNTSHELRSETQTFDITEICNNDVTKQTEDEGNKNHTKETVVHETGIPVKTERFTRGISREMCNIRQKANKESVTIEEVEDVDGQKVIRKTITNINVKAGIPIQKERISRSISDEKEYSDISGKDSTTTVETNTGSEHKITKESSSVQIGDDNNIGTLNLNDNKERNKKEALKTENIAKEGKPVFTKVTESFSKGKIQTVEMSKTIEWKPAEVKSKNYTRSVSEKITKKEFNDQWKIQAPTIISEVREDNKQPKFQSETEKTDVTSPTHKPKILEGKIKDTVKNIPNKIFVKKVTEYESKEQEINVEKKSFILSSSVDMTLRREPEKLSKDVVEKDSREIKTQMKNSEELGMDMDKTANDLKETGTEQSIFEQLKRDKAHKISREMNTQTSILEHGSRDKINNDCRDVGTQMSMTDSKDIKETYFKQVSEEYSTYINKESITTESATLKKESDREKDMDMEEVTILKGNVSRLKNKLYTKENKGVSKKETGEEVPKKKSILPKIAVFERLETGESYSVSKNMTTENKTSTFTTKKINVVDKPKVVEELLKEHPQLSSYTKDVEIGSNVTEIVTGTWKTQGDIKEDYETATILPGRLDFITNENKSEIAKLLPGKNDIDTQQSTIVEARPGKNIKTDNSLHEESTNISGKPDFEHNIGKARPGKIDLTMWKNKVQANKNLVDKKDVIKSESLKEITKTLPGSIELKTFEREIKVSKDLPSKIDSDMKENPEELIKNQNKDKILPDSSASITFTELIDEKTGNTQVKLVRPLQGKIDFTSTTTPIELPKILPDRNSYIKPENVDLQTSEKETEVDKLKPGKININLWKKQVEINKNTANYIDQNTSTDFKGITAIPARIDTKTYDSTVESSKPLPAKTDIETKVNKTEGIRTLPGRIDCNSPGKQIEIPTILPVKISEDSTKNRTEIVESLPDNIGFTVAKSPIEKAKTLPYYIDFNVSGNQIEEAKTLPTTFDSLSTDKLEKIEPLSERMDFSTAETQVEMPNILPAVVDFRTIENEKAVASTIPEKVDVKINKQLTNDPVILPGKLNLKAWKNQVEVNKTRVGTDRQKIESTRTISGTINVTTHQSRTEDLKTFAGKIDITSHESLESNQENTRNIQLKCSYTSIDSSANKDLDHVNIYGNDLKVTENKTAIPSNKPVSVVSDRKEEDDFEEMQKNTYSTGSTTKDQNQLTTIERTVSTVSSSRTVNYERTENIKENYRKVAMEYEFNSNTAKEEFISTEKNITTTETNEKELNYYTNKVENQFLRSESLAEVDKITREEMTRAKSLAELDLGDMIDGQVRKLIGKIKSVDFGRREERKAEKISVKEMPKKMSVLEKIALFEGKASTTRTESTTLRTKIVKKNVTQSISEEEYSRRIEELSSARTKYGRLEEMLYLPLANGVEMPVIALGTAMMDSRLLPHLVGAAIDLGYRAIDTAYIYGNEKEIGQAIRAKINDGTVKREDLFIMSKLWSTFHRPDLVEEACRNSLKNMGLDYFDLYMIHNPMSFKEGPDPIPKIATVLQYSEYDYLDAWFGMEDLVSKGLVKSIGVSNFNSQQIQRILDKGKLKPVVNQVECHPYLSQQRLHAFCADRNITLSCFGVLGSKGTPAEYKSSVSPVIDDALIQVIASGLNMSPAQLLIRYQLENGHNVVVKSSSAAHLWDNLQALTFTLEKPQVDALHALNRNKRIFTFKGMGDTHRNYPFLPGY